MTHFWTLVNQVIWQSDVLLILLDARLIQETRNIEIENKVKMQGKPLIYVITKSDLVDKKNLEKYKQILKPCVFISATKHFGTTLLRESILIQAKIIDKDKVKVGVLGYPNVGKSSLINAMKGKKSAPTSSTSGFTRSIRKVKADNRIMFLDTPGVIPFKERDPLKHALIGTIDYNKAKDPDLVVIELMNRYPGKIETKYGVEIKEDKEETIEDITKNKNILKRGGEPDTIRAARMILKDWQIGNIK